MYSGCVAGNSYKAFMRCHPTRALGRPYLKGHAGGGPHQWLMAAYNLERMKCGASEILWAWHNVRQEAEVKCMATARGTEGRMRDYVYLQDFKSDTAWDLAANSRLNMYK